MPVPAGEGAALEVVQAQAGLELAVVVLDPPADLGQADELAGGGVFGQGGQPVIRRLAGRTRMARKWLVMAASGLPRVALVPCRQVTGWMSAALAIASWRRFAGGCG